MKGSFETAKRKDGKGMCLKQISPKEGILWGGAGGDLPHTIVGDHNWTDYTIQADVLVTAGKAGIGGATGAANSAAWPGHPTGWHVVD